MFVLVKENVKIIKDFFYLMKGNKKWIFLLFVGSIFGHSMTLIIPVFASNIIYEVTSGNAGATYMNILFLAITYVAYNLSWYLNYVAYSHNFKYSYKRIREKIINKVFTYDTEFHNKLSKGKILNTINDDTSHLSEMIDDVCELAVVFVKILIMIGVFLYTNIYIGIFVLILEVIYLRSYDYCNKMKVKYLGGTRKYKDKITDNFSQILNGLDEIKVFNIYDKMKNDFRVVADRWADKYMMKRKYANFEWSLLPFVIHFGKIILYIVLVGLVLNGRYEVNTLILLITYFETITEDSEELMQYSSNIREWSVAIERINKILSYSGGQEISFGDNTNDNIDGLVEFKNVTFAYKTKNKGNIDDISFKAEPGKITALVGHSGSGKTTITNLLLRRYIADSGEILIDGEDIYSYSNKVYSTNVVGVNQFPFVFNMSIKKNLSLIDSDFENQVEACKRVGLHDYIMSLPKGYNTILTENATNFSGGQKQLLAIARTLLSKAEILIFDEVTSSLDPLTVEKIKEVFENLKIDHTIIIVTHKKDVMKMADKIIVLNKGRIVGQGSHSKLMKDNSYYIDLQTNNYSSSNKMLKDEIVVYSETEDKEKGKR